jgi:hypothetical protein
MKRKSIVTTVFAAAVTFFCLLAFAPAEELNNNEVELTGTIGSILMDGETVATLYIQFESVELKVLVSSKSELEDRSGESLNLGSLKPSDVVKVKGKFSPDGIVATHLRLLEKPDSKFELRDRISSVNRAGADTWISLLNLSILIPPDLYAGREGRMASSLPLKPGALVRVEGTVAEGVWTATSFQIVDEGGRKVHMHIGGVIRSADKDSFTVEVDGVTSLYTKVSLNSATEVSGEPVAGSVVEVDGKLNADFSMTASLLKVLPALEIKPAEKKMKVGETANFTVKLREKATSNVHVELTSSNDSLVSLTPPSLTFPAGSQTADFEAKALKPGYAKIIASVSRYKAEADVEIEQTSDSGQHPDAKISFSPYKVTMGVNETRDAVLLVSPPQKDPFSVNFKLSGDLVKVTGGIFDVGTAAVKVTLRSGSDAGAVTVVASLPSSLGGGKTELYVEVKKPVEAPNALQFQPDSVKLNVGESRYVYLVLSKASSKDTAISITGGGSVAETSSSVTIPAGTPYGKVYISGKAEGKTTLVATSGDLKAQLPVEVVKVQETPATLQFQPSSVKLNVGQPGYAYLVLSKASTKDTVISISGAGSVAEAASSVTIAAGTTYGKLYISGKAEGKTTLVATSGDLKAQLALEVAVAK